MIEGMTILKKTEIVAVEAKTGFWIPLVVTGVLAVFLLLFFTLLIDKKDRVHGTHSGPESLAFPAILCLAIVAFGAIKTLNDGFEKVSTGRYTYEVTFDSEEAFLETYKEYDIVKVNDTYEDVAGKIYTIKDKEP